MRLAILFLLLISASLRCRAQSCDSSFAVGSFGTTPGDSLYYMVVMDAPGDLDSLVANEYLKLPCMDWENYQWNVLAYCRWCLRCGEGRAGCHRNACMTTWEFSPIPR